MNRNRAMTEDKKIAVLMGGPGSERKVSLASGAGVAQALRELGAEVTEVDVDGPDFACPPSTEIAFNVIHGTFGEDGQMQRILEARGIPYTGEGVAGSELAIDKIATKQRFVERHVPTAAFEILRDGAAPTLPLPYVIKAPREGSSVGVFIVRERGEGRATRCARRASYGSELLVEKFIAGRELTVGVVGDQALPIIEIKRAQGLLQLRKQVSVSRIRKPAARRSSLPRAAQRRRSRGCVQEIALAGASRARPRSLFAASISPDARRRAVRPGDQYHSRHDAGRACCPRPPPPRASAYARTLRPRHRALARRPSAAP